MPAKRGFSENLPNPTKDSGKIHRVDMAKIRETSQKALGRATTCFCEGCGSILVLSKAWTSLPGLVSTPINPETEYWHFTACCRCLEQTRFEGVETGPIKN